MQNVKNVLYIILICTIPVFIYANQTGIASIIVVSCAFVLFLDMFKPWSARFEVLNKSFLMILQVFLPLFLISSLVSQDIKTIEVLQHFCWEMLRLGPLMAVYGCLASIARPQIVYAMTWVRQKTNSFIASIVIDITTFITGEVIAAKSTQLIFGDEVKEGRLISFVPEKFLSWAGVYNAAVNLKSAGTSALLPIGGPSTLIAFEIGSKFYPHLAYFWWMKAFFLIVIAYSLFGSLLMTLAISKTKRNDPKIETQGAEWTHGLRALLLKFSIIVIHLLAIAYPNLLALEVVMIWIGIFYFIYIERPFSSWKEAEEKVDDLPLLTFMPALVLIGAMINKSILLSLMPDFVMKQIVSFVGTALNDNAFMAEIITPTMEVQPSWMFVVIVMWFATGFTWPISNAHVEPSLAMYEKMSGKNRPNMLNLGLMTIIFLPFMILFNYGIPFVMHYLNFI